MSDAAEVPVTGATQSNKDKNKARLQALKDAKARKATAATTGDAVAAPGSTGPAKVKKERAPKAEKTVRACRCGCGGQTTAYFVPGHDARWKGWMKKIEMGKKEPKELADGTKAMYKFVKRGIGYVPTKNYNDLPYVPQCADEDVMEEAVPDPKVVAKVGAADAGKK